MLKIRLARGGSKKRPFYRVVVADVRSPRTVVLLRKLDPIIPCLIMPMKAVFN